VRRVGCPAEHVVTIYPTNFGSFSVDPDPFAARGGIIATMTTAEWRISDSTTEIKRLTNALLRYFNRRLPQQDDAEDYVGAVWLAAGKGFQRRSTLHHYVFQIARKMVMGRWRQVRRRGQFVQLSVGFDGDLPSDAPGCETVLEMLREHEVVRRALPQVNPVYRDVLRLWLDGRDAIQIADALGLQYHTARSRIARGRKELIEMIRLG
jgi:RNA polymerase sigma factor (sigma-70 family)